MLIDEYIKSLSKYKKLNGVLTNEELVEFSSLAVKLATQHIIQVKRLKNHAKDNGLTNQKRRIPRKVKKKLRKQH